MTEPAIDAFSCFRRDRVPSVAELLCLLNLTASKPNRSGYMQMCCPIHDEENPSLSVHLEHGNWKCFACGATGGDVLNGNDASERTRPSERVPALTVD